MFCPGCSAETESFSSVILSSGRMFYSCRSCAVKAPPALRPLLNKKFRSHRQRRFDAYELPKEISVRTQKAAPRDRFPDNPVLRDRLDIGKIASGKRAVVFEDGSTRKSDRNSRVMQKLVNKLGQNPKIITDDGWRVLAESTVR